MEESSPSFSCMDTAYGYGSLPTPKIAGYKVQYLHVRYLKLLGKLVTFFNLRPLKLTAFKPLEEQQSGFTPINGLK